MPLTSEPQPTRRGVGPTLFGQFARDRGLRFAAGLAIAVAVPVAILFYFRFQSLNSLQRASTVVLQQLSDSAADDLTKSIEQDLKRPHLEVLLRSQYQTEPLNLEYVRSVFINGLKKNPFVDAFYVWSTIGGSHSNQVLAVEREPEPGVPGAHRAVLLTDVPEGPFILQTMQRLAAHGRSIVLARVSLNGRPTWLEFQLRFRQGTHQLSSFVGLRVDEDRLRHEYLPALMRQKMQQVQVPAGFPPLVVTLFDEHHHIIFNSSDRVPTQFAVQRRFPLVFFDKDLLEAVRAYEPDVTDWQLSVGFGHRTIGGITRSETASQVGLMAALAAVMALGVFFVARAAAHEVRLAELKSNFVSSVSHDLKTPLALIQMFAETLELGRLRNADRAREYYRIINSEARKLTRLINNILDFSKTEAGLRRYQMEPVDLADLTGRILASFESQFQQNHFDVTANLQGGCPPVWADPEAVEQAVENLLSNAMKYSPDRRQIEIETGVAGQYGCVQVKDHGVGIPPRFRRKIFRKFYRVEPDDGHGPQGCGLGLAIVDYVMRAHGGRVGVESEPGQGSTFTLQFPLCGSAAAVVEKGAEREPLGQMIRPA